MTASAAPPTVKPLPEIPDYGSYAIDVKNLSFTYATSAGYSTLDTPGSRAVLKNCDLQLAKGSRCLLIGANGSGMNFFMPWHAIERMPPVVKLSHNTRHFWLG